MECEVIGQRKIRPRRGKDAPSMVRIELSGDDGLTASFPVAWSERDQFPIGSQATLAFTMQMSLGVTQPGEGGRAQEDKPSKRARGNGRSEEPSDPPAARARPAGPDVWPPDGASSAAH